MNVFDDLENWLDQQLIPLKLKVNEIYELIINGKSFQVKSKKIKYVNRQVISGRDVVMDDIRGNITIEFKGGLASLDCMDAIVHGSVYGDVNSQSLTINGDVDGDVNGMDVKAKKIHGDVSAMNVRVKK